MKPEFFAMIVDLPTVICKEFTGCTCVAAADTNINRAETVHTVTIIHW